MISVCSCPCVTYAPSVKMNLISSLRTSKTYLSIYTVAFDVSLHLLILTSFVLVWDTKVDVWQNVQAVLFHTLKVNEEHLCAVF